MALLKVGHKVYWRGAWGTEAPKVVKVTAMQQVTPGQKYGKDVKSMDWQLVQSNHAVVDLDNGKWAYGDQLAPL